MASFDMEYKPVNGSYKCGNKAAGFNKIGWIFRMIRRILTSQEGLCSMWLVS